MPRQYWRAVCFYAAAREITKTAVKEAIKHPREINMNLVNSQQARRILDRIVGYKISPFLWKNVKGRLSAGRVQSAATRLIAERESEIKSFKPTEYYVIEAEFSIDGKDKFTAKYGNPYRCSCCSEEFGDTYNYCPNCGVSMKEVE